MVIDEKFEEFYEAAEYLDSNPDRRIIMVIDDQGLTYSKDKVCQDEGLTEESEGVVMGIIQDLCKKYGSLTIFGGDMMAGTTNSSRKKHVLSLATQFEGGIYANLFRKRPSPFIYFDDDDLRGFVGPNEDAVVIATEVA